MTLWRILQQMIRVGREVRTIQKGLVRSHVSSIGRRGFRKNIENYMRKILSTVVFFISLIVSTLIAVNISSFLERDACVNAGGSYQALTGLCDIDGGYIPLFSRAGLYIFWFLFVMLVNIPTLIAFYLLKYLGKNIAKR